MDKVLVVGGRATGLMMTLELARRGVPTRCIDLSSSIDPHVRANLVHSRTLEIFQGLGLDEEVSRGSTPEKGYVFYHDGARVLERPHATIEPPFPYGLAQVQPHTEAVLETHLKSFGAQVERGIALAALAQDADGVDVTLHDENGAEEQDRFQWVIGCDGAHSTLRHLLGDGFSGEQDAIPYILGDVVISGAEDLEPHKAHVFLHRSGEFYVFTRLPENRFFLIASLDKEAAPAGTPVLEELQNLATERARSSFQLSDPRWLGYFQIHHRLAPRYRRDRVFLAGDAAHIQSPFGGHGMNTGIQDAHNLAWKLALVVQKRAKAEILDTYSVERRPVAEELLETTRQITNAMESYHTLSEPDRDTFISSLVLPEEAQLEAARHLQEVDLDYSASPLCLTSEDSVQAGPAPGVRAPDASDVSVAGHPTSLFKMPTEAGYRLYLFQGASNAAPLAELTQAAETAQRYAALLTPYIVKMDMDGDGFGEHAVILDPQGTMHEIYGASSPCAYLIRPDGYVAYRSAELSSVDKYFDTLDLFAE
ncbi:MAG: FAD-dependent monooxygenase [Pseudomonadota bacterium]